jgi:predicted transcriptional regulator
MTDWTYVSSKQGLATVFFDYEIEALHTLWGRNGEYLTSREVWQQVSGKMTISRASIINSLNRMAKSGILDSKEITGKGGYRGLYAATKSEAELRRMIAEELTQSIKKNLS